MSINQDIKTLGKDLTDEARNAGQASVEQTKNTVSAVKTPVYAVIGASDHAAKVARELVTDLRSRAETFPADLKTRAENLPGEVRGAADEARLRATAQASAVRPEALRETVIGVLTEAVSTARKAVRRYEKRGQMVVADLRRTPGFTKVLKSAEGAVDLVEDALEGLIRDAQGELKDVRKSAGNTASKAKATVRKASTRKTPVRKSTPAKSNTAKATAAKVTATRATATKARATKARATKATATKATATKATATKATAAKRSPAKKSTSKASSNK